MPSGCYALNRSVDNRRHAIDSSKEENPRRKLDVPSSVLSSDEKGSTAVRLRGDGGQYPSLWCAFEEAKRNTGASTLSLSSFTSEFVVFGLLVVSQGASPGSS